MCLAPVPLVHDQLDNGRDGIVGGGGGHGPAVATVRTASLELRIEHVNGATLVGHSYHLVEVAGLVQETCRRIDGNLGQQRRLQAVGNVDARVGVGRVGIAVEAGLEAGDEFDVCETVSERRRMVIVGRRVKRHTDSHQVGVEARRFQWQVCQVSCRAGDLEQVGSRKRMAAARATLAPVPAPAPTTPAATAAITVSVMTWCCPR